VITKLKTATGKSSGIMTVPKTALFCPRIRFHQVFTWRINSLIRFP